MKSIVLMLIVLIGAAISYGQERSSGFNFSAPFAAQGVREENLQVGTTTIDDYSMVLSGPGFSLVKATPISTFAIGYIPEFQLFANNRDLNTWNHEAELRFSGRLTPRFTLSVNDYATRTQDPTRSLGETMLVMPRSDFRENVFDVAFEYNIQRNTILTIGGNNTWSQWRLVSTPIAGRFTNITTAGTAGITQVIKQRHRLSASYAALKIKVIDTPAGLLPPTEEVTDPTHSVGGGYRYTKDRGFTVEIAGNKTRGGFDSYGVSGQVERRWATALLGVSYLRQISALRGLTSPLTGIPDTGIQPQLATGVLPTNILQAATFRYRQMLARNVGVELRALAGRQDFSSSQRDIDSLTGRFRMYFRTSDRITFFAGAESYTQNFNDLLGRSFSRQRYLGGLLISLSRREEPEELVDPITGEERVRDISTEWPDDWGRE